VNLNRQSTEDERRPPDVKLSDKLIYKRAEHARSYSRIKLLEALDLTFVRIC